MRKPKRAEDHHEVPPTPAWAEKYPPILSPDQAAEFLQVPKQTVYAWSSRGLLDPCKTRAGRHLRFFRDELIQLLREGKLHGTN